jgi:hypothetical protein
MRILFDQGTPAPLRKSFDITHSVDLAFELGWATLKNGELVKAAEAGGYDVLLTTDKNFRHQQNLSGLRLAVVVLPTTSWPKLKTASSKIALVCESALPGSVTEIAFD